MDIEEMDLDDLIEYEEELEDRAQSDDPDDALEAAMELENVRERIGELL
ncbi:hypothetical protein KIW74_gp21 [Mycobacterium phage Kimona]|uniref:Uncharacterized protein n=1 Tax=Mycobacterium phage Kimona TaxID=2024295 RepID=A0A249XU97_9CAUD|nr:hypothetical protein KIW74_gp21 [Mycobacterium phage Kimona]ASZ75507.1 hypothetical protein PBI_KIMONA_71 [Mycobacterium phage Kimona]